MTVPDAVWNGHRQLGAFHRDYNLLVFCLTIVIRLLFRDSNLIVLCLAIVIRLLFHDSKPFLLCLAIVIHHCFLFRFELALALLQLKEVSCFACNCHSLFVKLTG